MKKTVNICDRCGKEIKYGIFPQAIATVDYTIAFSFGSYDYSTSKYDLCGDCVKALGKFLEMEDT